MEIISIVKGSFAHLRLNDGYQIYIDITPEKIKVYSQSLNLVQPRLIWQKQFQYPLRYNDNSLEILLENVLGAVEQCKRIVDLKYELGTNIELIINNFWTSGKPPSPEDTCWVIIEAYCKAIETVQETMKAQTIDIYLPYPKDEIERAITKAMITTNDNKLKTALLISKNSLNFFLMWMDC